MFEITVRNGEVWLEQGDLTWTLPPEVARALAQRILVAAQHAAPSRDYVLMYEHRKVWGV